MRKILIFILLGIHLNFSAFIPQFDEVDRIDRNGNKVDDINSLFEFIYEVALGNSDATPEDEDNDHVRYFHIVRMGTYFCQNVQSVKDLDAGLYRVIRCPITKEEKIHPVFFEIPSPPPKA